MSFVFKLPEVLLCDVLKNLISWRDVGRLDSAVCSTNDRKEFLSILSHPSCVFSEMHSQYRSPAWRWIVDRRVRIAEIKFDETLLRQPQYRKEALAHLGPAVEFFHLSLHTSSENADELANQCLILSEVQMYCVNLKSVCIQFNGFIADQIDVKADVELAQFISSVPKLSHLSITNGRISLRVLAAICASLNLRSVGLEYCQYEGGANMLATHSLTVQSLSIANNAHMCVHFPHLLHLHAHALPEHLLLIAELCPRLLNVAVSLHYSYNDAVPLLSQDAVFKMASHWKHIRTALFSGGTKLMSEEAVVDFITLCPTLESLDFISMAHDYQPPLSDVTYPASYTGSRLTRINFYCAAATTLRYVTTHCRYLRTLQMRSPDIDCNWQATVYPPEFVHVETALHCIASTCITSLELHDYPRLDNARILTLQNTRIQHFTLINPSSQVNTATVLNLVATLPQLNKLVLRGCSGVEDNVVLLVPPLCPGLRSFSYTKDSNYCSLKQQVCETLLRMQFPTVAEFDVRW